MSSASSLEGVEGIVLVTLFVGYALWFVIRMLGRSRPDFRIGRPIAIGFAIRLAAIAGIGAAGLSSTLRGGDETTFLDLAHQLASQPFGRDWWPHGARQLQTVVFALQLKLGFLTQAAMRITQVGIATLGVVLILAAVYDLSNGRAARLAAWVMALEPASIFFNSALHKEPNMELAAGLVAFGGAMMWKRLDIRALLLFALGGLIAVETRSYAGWFLVSAAVLISLHAALRGMDRPMRAMPLIYGVVIIAFLATPVLLEASSKANLNQLQVSQTANATGLGNSGCTGANCDNLALESVDFSTRGAILTNLPQRIRDVILRPYPWQLGDTSQRFAAVGTLVAYAILFFLIRYLWLSRGEIFARAAPLLYPMMFLLIAYSLAAGNAGTGFRYRTHLVTLAIATMAILGEQVRLAREKTLAPAPLARQSTRPRRAVPASV